jgi:hypothetical protein
MHILPELTTETSLIVAAPDGLVGVERHVGGDDDVVHQGKFLIVGRQKLFFSVATIATK